MAPREERILHLTRAELGREIAAAEELLTVYLDLLGAVEEEYRLTWPGEESRIAFLACLLRLFDDLLAGYYLVLRGLYLQASRVWQDYLEALWLALYFVSEPAGARRWLRGGRVEPSRARRTLEARGAVGPQSGELYLLLDRQAHPRAKAGFERAFVTMQQMGEWQTTFFVGGEGNTAWVRRALHDWLFVAIHGLDEIASLGLIADDTQWSHRRVAATGAAQRLLGGR